MALALLALAGCGGDAEPGPDASATPVYSPNGEPLSGGPLGHPTCEAALAAWFDRIDGGHQGAIDRAQYLADAGRQFAAMDIDGRGEVTPEELSRYRAPFESDAVKLRSGSGGKGGGRPEKVVLGEDAADPVMVADVSLRFRVSRAEFLAYEARKFDAFDKGHSGRLTKAQIVATCPKPP